MTCTMCLSTDSRFKWESNFVKIISNQKVDLGQVPKNGWFGCGHKSETSDIRSNRNKRIQGQQLHSGTASKMSCNYRNIQIIDIHRSIAQFKNPGWILHPLCSNNTHQSWNKKRLSMFVPESIKIFPRFEVAVVMLSTASNRIFATEIASRVWDDRGRNDFAPGNDRRMLVWHWQFCSFETPKREGRHQARWFRMKHRGMWHPCFGGRIRWPPWGVWRSGAYGDLIEC